MLSRYKIQIVTGLSLILILSTGPLLPGLAAPPAQAPILPTPTLYPVENVPYTLDLIAEDGIDHWFNHGSEPLTAIPPGSLFLGDLWVTSHYPRGIEFAAQPMFSKDDTIDAMTLTIRFPTDLYERYEMAWGADRAAWIAHIWSTGGGIPAWTQFEYAFRFRMASGDQLDTSYYPAIYADPTRQWWRAESEDAILYWFGFGDDNPDQVASRVFTAIAATEPRRIAGFGQTLSYGRLQFPGMNKPVNVIYDSPESLAEFYGSGVTDRGSAERFGVTILAAPDANLDAQIGWLEFVVPHEMTHLYQFDVLGSATGPMWWAEGQANWFATTPGEYDARLRHLATLQELPTLTGPISLDLPQADGRRDLGYDMGASFINWLLAHYGGIETHAQIVALMRSGTDLYRAIETVTGEPFFAIENAWREYIGVPPFTLADRDPAAALEPIPDPVAAIGETITLPAASAMVMLYEDPIPNALVSGSCWANTEITILRAGRRDGVDYYEVDCMGQTGWVTGDQIVGVK